MTSGEQASENVPAVPLTRDPIRKPARARKKDPARKKDRPRKGTQAPEGARAREGAEARKDVQPHKKASPRKRAKPRRRAKERQRAMELTRAQYTPLLGWSDAAPRGVHRVWRFALVGVRRTVGVAAGLSVLGSIIVTGLLMVTPSVGNAPALAMTLIRAHRAVYPGPPVPARFVSSLISTEDHRFYSEPGIDPFAVGRVILGRIMGQPDQGGATLYQQLAKMLYTRGRPGIVTPAEEAILGIKLDLKYSKPQILQMYADVAYFGHGYYGLPAASCGYFGVPPAALTWPQAAMLAGLVQAPSADDPLTHLANARAREAHVLSRLVATGRLSLAQAQSAYRDPLHLVRGHAARCLPAPPNTP
jgi:Transglycosylase